MSDVLSLILSYVSDKEVKESGLCPKAAESPSGEVGIISTGLFDASLLTTQSACAIISDLFFIVDANSGAKSIEVLGDPQDELFIIEFGTTGVDDTFLNKQDGLEDMGGDNDIVGTMKEVVLLEQCDVAIVLNPSDLSLFDPISLAEADDTLHGRKRLTDLLSSRLTSTSSFLFLDGLSKSDLKS